MPEDMQLIKKLLERDPKRHMYEVTNPNHMINRENSFGLRPLYIACLHGHLEVVKTLLSIGADPKLLSTTNIDTREQESILQLAARWSHLQILNFLLNGEIKWKNQEIQLAVIETAGE